MLGTDAALSAHCLPVLTGIYRQACPFEIRANLRPDLRRMLADSPGSTLALFWLLWAALMQWYLPGSDNRMHR